MARYKNLKMLMYMYDIHQCDIAQIIGRSPSYVAVRMTGRADWAVRDVYLIHDYFHQQDNEIDLVGNFENYFPREGIGTQSRKTV